GYRKKSCCIVSNVGKIGGDAMSYNAKIRADAMSLNPIDDALFVKMAESLKVCQEMLRVFLRDKQLIVLENKRIFKTTEEGVNEMCEVIERNRAEARAEGRYEIVADMLRDGMNIDTVARIAKMTAEQVMAIGKKAAVL
ncbi:MAG: hypothetical protein SOV95_04075, partial [Anaerovibrio sp.]|nr:hypothetical protein [Anaerovibrio sp.]MDY2603437.1 hypothetical protein [Anaerovibrio sp.]